MVIGFDGSRAFDKGRTGTENYSYQLLVNLSKIDTENNFKVYIRPPLAASFAEAAAKAEKATWDKSGNDWPKNFEFVTINWPRFWTQGGLGLQTFKDNLDVLFVPSHTLPVLKKPGLKTVITVHDLGAEYLPKMHQIKQRLYLNFMTRYQLKGATKIIAVSKATKEDLIKRAGIEEKKIEVIYEGVDRSVFKRLNSDTLINTLRQYKLQPKTYFLFVGTIQPRKNLERLIKAFYQLAAGPASSQPHSMSSLSPRLTGLSLRVLNGAPRSLSPANLNLILVGKKGWMADEIYALPKKLGIESRVKFLGRVKDEDLAALYNGAIGLVFPSLSEGFGLPILEAFASDCPVLTSNLSSMKEIAGEAAVLVDPISAESISKGMLKLMNEENWSKLIKEGRIRVEKFSWEKTAQETLKVLQEV